MVDEKNDRIKKRHLNRPVEISPVRAFLANLVFFAQVVKEVEAGFWQKCRVQTTAVTLTYCQKQL